jgi:hypothetical protein
MSLRKWILGGFALSLFTITFTFGKILLIFPILVIVSLVTLLYSYAAIREIPARTGEEALALKRGVQWGVAIGCIWAAGFLVSMMLFALLAPFVAGALSAVESGKVRMGLRAGFWSGMVGGLIGFLLFASGGYLRAWLSGVGVFAYMESNEFGAIVLATYILFLYGPVFCPVAATVGGWIGIQLEKTGRTSSVADPPIASRP